MKIRLLSVLIAGLFAGAAMAQPSTTTKMPDPNSAVVAPAGGAQGQTPTAINTPDKGTDVKATPVPGSVAMEKQEKVVNTKPEQVQGSTSSAAKAGMEKPGASTSGKSMDKMDDMNNKKAEPAVVVTTPAPGPANTTPTTPKEGPGPASK